MILTTPFPVAYAPELWRWLNTPRDPNFEDGAIEDFADFLPELEARIQTEKTFALCDAVSGQPIGFVGFAPAGTMGFFRGVVIAPERRGHGLGSAFLRLAVKALRAQGTNKLCGMFFADNVAIRSAFRRAGAVEEGYLKGAAMRNGKTVDMRLWSFNAAGVE